MPGVIERALLFKPGDALSVRVLEESERVLRTENYLYDVKFRPLAWHDGVVDIEVATRDTWSLDLGFSAGRSGGSNSSGFHLKEYNLLGSGVSVGLGHSRTRRPLQRRVRAVERPRLGHLDLDRPQASRATATGGETLSVVRPFYQLDARWTAGVTAVKDDRIDSIYNAGEIASQYRHRGDRAEAFGGWSDGLIGGWVRRYSAGVGYSDDRYALQPAVVAPGRLPSDEKRVGPFVRFELIEDRFERLLNRNLIGRPEFFALGLASKVQLGWATTAWGSNSSALLYAGTISGGIEPGAGQILTGVATLSGQRVDGRIHRQTLGGALRYYRPQGPRSLFYAAASADTLSRPDVGDALLLGGDNGLRGYPLRYQSGEHHAVHRRGALLHRSLRVPPVPDRRRRVRRCRPCLGRPDRQREGPRLARRRRHRPAHRQRSLGLQQRAPRRPGLPAESGAGNQAAAVPGEDAGEFLARYVAPAARVVSAPAPRPSPRRAAPSRCPGTTQISTTATNISADERQHAPDDVAAAGCRARCS